MSTLSIADVRAVLPSAMIGAIFVFVGIAAFLVAATRRRRKSLILVWCGCFIGMFGLRMLAEVIDQLSLAPGAHWPSRIVISVDYLLVIPGVLFWRELSTRWLRWTLDILAIFSSAVSLAAWIWTLLGGRPSALLPVNSLLAIALMVIMGVIGSIPSITRKCLALETQVLRFVFPVLAALTLYANIRYLFGVPPSKYFEPVGFAIWIFALGYEAAHHTFETERRLVAIDRELEMARQIQTAILPACVPTINGLEISLSYKPMSAVAGDFYQFIQHDNQRIGFLVADVTGHGVPAALIASMIKVAMQSVHAVADSPSDLLAGLNRILTAESGGRLTSAAYLWIDADQRIARYSAAGHPPLLRWKSCQRSLERIESNGLLFGIASSCAYPTTRLSIEPGDRFLLYTDGLVEPENSSGEAFGDRELERTLSLHPNDTAPRLSSEILAALKRWSVNPISQQDDITLLIIGIQ